MQDCQQPPLHGHHSVADRQTFDMSGRGDLVPNYDNCKFRRRLIDERSYLIQGFVNKMRPERGAVEPIGILLCPFPRCKAQFEGAAYLIDHMITCDGYASGEFYCPDCKRYEPIPVPKDPESKHSWVKRKASDFVRRLSGRRSPSPKSSTHTTMSSPPDATCRQDSECVSDGLILDPPRAESTLEPIEFAETIDKHIAKDQFKHIMRALYASQSPSHISYHPKPAGPFPSPMAPQSAAPFFLGAQAHIPPHAMLSNPQLSTIDWNHSQSSTASYGSSLSSFDLTDIPIPPAKEAPGHPLAQFNWQPAPSQLPPLLDRGISASPIPMEPNERPESFTEANNQWVPELSGSPVAHEMEGSVPKLPSTHRPIPRRVPGPNGARFAAPNYANASVGSIDASFYTVPHDASETRVPASVYPPTPVRTETTESSSTNRDSGYGTEQTTKDADAALSPLDVRDDWSFARLFTPSPPSSERTQSPLPDPSPVSPLSDVHTNASSDDLVCPVCGYVPRGKAENRKRYLVKHKEVHKNNRFPCDLCPSAYNRKDNLVKHLRTDHCSVRPAKRPADGQKPARASVKRPKCGEPNYC